MKNLEHILDLIKKNRIFRKNIEYPYYGEKLSQKVKKVIYLHNEFLYKYYSLG